jgi:hypothetical protein
MSSRPTHFITRHDTAHTREMRRQRRVLAGMAVALAVVMALTVSAPFWASLYLCVRWGCQ